MGDARFGYGRQHQHKHQPVRRHAGHGPVQVPMAGADMPWIVPGTLDLWATPVDSPQGRPRKKAFIPATPPGPGQPPGQRPAQDKPRKDDGSGSFSDTIMPVVRIMQLVMALPLQRADDGTFTFKWLSPVMLYSVLAYALLTAPVAWVGGTLIRQFLAKESAPFHEQIYNMTPLLLLHSHALIPVLYWRQGRAVAGYYNSWISYESDYHRVCSRPLELGLNKTLAAQLLGVLALAAVSTGTMPLYMSLTVYQSLAYLHLFLLSYSLVLTWRFSAVALCKAAELLRDSLHEEVMGGRCTSDTMSEYRQVWLQLSELTQESGRAWTYSCGHQLLYQFLLMTVTAFGVLAGVTRPHSLDARTLAFGGLAAMSALVLFIVCSVAETAADKVSQVLREDLLTAQLSGDGQHFKNEVQMFMTALAMNPPSVNLSGYATVNRALFASLLETMVTYLVVLVQFAYSLDQPAPTAATGSPAAGASGATAGPGASLAPTPASTGQKPTPPSAVATPPTTPPA